MRFSGVSSARPACPGHVVSRVLPGVPLWSSVPPTNPNWNGFVPPVAAPRARPGSFAFVVAKTWTKWTRSGRRHCARVASKYARRSASVGGRDAPPTSSTRSRSFWIRRSRTMGSPLSSAMRTASR